MDYTIPPFWFPEIPEALVFVPSKSKRLRKLARDVFVEQHMERTIALDFANKEIYPHHWARAYQEAYDATVTEEGKQEIEGLCAGLRDQMIELTREAFDKK